MKANIEDWDRAATGEIEIFPVIGWQVSAAAENVLFRLEFVIAENTSATAQLCLSPDLVERFCFALQTNAKLARKSRAAPH